MPLVTPLAKEANLEARLRLELQRWTAVTPAMLHSIDEKGLLASVSDAWLAKLGYTRDEVLGRRSSDFLTVESREHAVRNVLPEFFRSGRCDNMQYQTVCKDGSVIDVLLSAVSKNSFHVVGHNARGAIVLRQKWSRGQVEARPANIPPCLIGMEACVGANHLSRERSGDLSPESADAFFLRTP